MRFKNWVSITLLIINALLIFSLLIFDNVKINILCLAIALVNTMLLTKYSKLWIGDKNERR